MRAVAARVSTASVSVSGATVARLDRPGLLVLLGVTHADGPTTASTMARKLFELRILPNEESCATAGAPMLIVSQFTLYGRTNKGRRPSWTEAAPGDVAEPLVGAVVAEVRRLGGEVQTGVFGAQMAVSSVNDGPFTVIVEV